MTTTAQKGEFAKSLELTTPPVTGKKVRDAQWLLAGHNKFIDPNPPQGVSKTLAILTGRLDGVYGPVTAGATKEAKYELGYPSGDINTAFGQTLYDYLTGQAQVPETYLTTRHKRLATTNKIKALDYAIACIGIKESPVGSNDTRFGQWYGMNGVPWCAIFVSYCINEALGTLSNPKWKYSYVPAIAQDAADGRNHMSITYSPQPGDLVTYNWDGPNCHIEFFKEELDNGSFSAVGGNTLSGEASSNGGQVAQSIRHNYQVTHFIRLSI